MIKYCGSLNVNIFTKIEPRFIIIATAWPYTQGIKNTKNGGLPCKHFYLEKIFNVLFSIIVLTNYEYNYNVSTDQIIRKTILNYGLKVYAPLLTIKLILPSPSCNVVFTQSYICLSQVEQMTRIRLWPYQSQINDSILKLQQYPRETIKNIQSVNI